MADLVEQLLARPGLYVGVQTRPGDTSDEPPGVARVEVTPLPGGSGVMLAYEVLAPTGELAHHEHAVITTVIAEVGPGHFPAAEGTVPFPMAVDLDVPAPGHLIYKWSYGWGDEPIALRDVGDVHAVS
jgi:hypothetical protein